MEKLRAALGRAGVVLPSLGVEATSYTREAGCPLVDLGRCTVDTALRMAVALPRGEAEGAGQR
ncbi:hypothetical protein ACIQM4_16600 [Streptomyces sp. NPDC091272]|uniref:hypothetical protein n=1 Tax=Streptomyces sp. NPDC091272 TaxID=3365981 RepID=UPI00382646EC